MTERRDATVAALESLRAAVARAETDDESPQEHTGRGGRRQGTQRSRPSPPPEEEPESDPHSVARMVVLRQLTNAPKTRHQLEQVLAKRECPPEVARAVLDRMAEVGLVDDAAYARMFARSKQAGRGLSRRAIAHELRGKGVDDEDAEVALADIDEEDERRVARALVDKKLASMHGLDASVQARRLAGLLARKGYAGGLALALIRQAMAEAPEHRRD